MAKSFDRDRAQGSFHPGRRSFLKGASALGLAALAGATVSSPRAYGAPQKGGTLRQALRGGSTSDSLDGTTLQAAHPISVSWQVRNNLTEVDANGDVVGELAESWEPSDDAKVWVFNLRKGVEFHNGKTLEAQDVVYSINQHRGEDTKSGAASIVKAVKDIRADGKDRVIIELSEGNADFAFLMSDYHLVVGIDGTTGDDWDKGIGTGPFMLESFEPGILAVTKRNPNYFKEGRPYFDAVETMHIADVMARTNVLQTGEADVIEQPDLKTLHLLKRQKGIVINEVGGTRHFPYPMLMTVPPFDDPDVQMALKYSVDRDAWVQKILKGHGYVGNDHPVGRNQRYFAGDLEQRTYDPDQAKFHLKKAGQEGLALPLVAAEVYPGGVDGAILYQESAKAAGIDHPHLQQVVDPDHAGLRPEDHHHVTEVPAEEQRSDDRDQIGDDQGDGRGRREGCRGAGVGLGRDRSNVGDRRCRRRHLRRGVFCRAYQTDDLLGTRLRELAADVHALPAVIERQVRSAPCLSGVARGDRVAELAHVRALTLHRDTQAEDLHPHEQRLWANGQGL